MTQCRLNGSVGLFIAVLIFGALVHPVAACTLGTPFAAGKPFSDTYFDDGRAVFRGRPIQYRRLGYAAEITFAVKATYQGEHRDTWEAIWQNSTFGLPDSLGAFRNQIGDDLVIVLRDFVAKEVRGQITVIRSYPGGESAEQLPLVVQGMCREPAMQTFEVMEPVLRAKGFIE